MLQMTHVTYKKEDIFLFICIMTGNMIILDVYC